jgi:hypothetical protein
MLTLVTDTVRYEQEIKKRKKQTLSATSSDLTEH